MYRGTKTKMIANFSSESVHAKRHVAVPNVMWQYHVKYQKKKQTKTLT